MDQSVTFCKMVNAYFCSQTTSFFVYGSPCDQEKSTIVWQSVSVAGCMRIFYAAAVENTLFTMAFVAKFEFSALATHKFGLTLVRASVSLNISRDLCLLISTRKYFFQHLWPFDRIQHVMNVRVNISLERSCIYNATCCNFQNTNI